MASRSRAKPVPIPDCEVLAPPSIRAAMRAGNPVADHRDPLSPSAGADVNTGTGGAGAPPAQVGWFRRPFVFLRAVVLRFRRWSEDQQTWAALRHLDDNQLKEFGIDPRPPDLSQRKFP